MKMGEDGMCRLKPCRIVETFAGQDPIPGIVILGLALAVSIDFFYVPNNFLKNKNILIYLIIINS